MGTHAHPDDADTEHVRRDRAIAAEPTAGRGGAGALGFDRAAGAGRAIREWVAAHQADVLIATSLTVLAAGLRFWDLGGMPPGLHGDEAWTGIDARRILDEGWIGAYVRSALGQPTGPLYWTALLFTFLPDSTTTIRLSMAILGVATIPLTYAAFSTMFNRTTGAFAALLLAVLTWHLHLSRTGFMVTSWPMMEMAVLWTLWLAFRRESAWLYALSGGLLGLGVHTYNAYLLFVPLPLIALAIMPLYAASKRRARGASGAGIPRHDDAADVPAVLRPGAPAAHLRYGIMCAIFAVAALLGALPLLGYVVENRDTYRSHQRVVSLLDAPHWKEAGFTERVDLVWERAKNYHRGLTEGDDGKYTVMSPGKGNGVEEDHGDGLATAGHPPIDPLIYFFALAGIAWCVVNVRRPAYVVALASLALLPLGALLTIDWGMYRRTLGLAPFVALFAALPLAAIWDRAWAGSRQGPRAWAFALLAAAVAVVPAVAGVRAVESYFGDLDDDPTFRFVYAPEMTAASEFIADLPPGTDVYWYSERWRFTYETRRFLAPDATAYDRAKLTLEQQATPPDLSLVRRDRDVAMIFLGAYVDAAFEAQQRYPGGTLHERRGEDGVMYRAYLLPAEP